MFKKWLIAEMALVVLVGLGSGLSSCENPKKAPMADNAQKKSTPPTQGFKIPLNQNFKSYWYAGEAEISAYDLKQERYGELRDGKAVLIYVTEPFLAEQQVKADAADASNIPVLKLNATKKYLTGIYPYSIMTSTFSPVYQNQQALKIAFSAQEWCGQVYMQLNNKDNFAISSHSYFASEGDQALEIPKAVLENELWNQIRIDPSNLPTGSFQAIPSFEYLRLYHKEISAYGAKANLKTAENKSTYTLEYPDLGRKLSIFFETGFPHRISGWEETSATGSSNMVSTATRINTLKTPYWQQNGNAFLPLRDSLGL